ncbi:putative permease C29B12,14c [Rhizoctonia solani AG-1 IB]|uniref:Putative permease C29B12,14c n=1 Tax=Thanatephorus cucumeris (strain AG1-IB / isolate 7/3/14) TaxID=1108050 RepID=M5BS82_THACB|nr:putative permease C29B12,14c [Rhizoctonia solani AG-1 IB]
MESLELLRFDLGEATEDIEQINTWMIAWICVWLGYGVVAPFIVLNARPGAIQHITFPVVARTSFGLWGSLWCTFNRGAMACIWYGVQASIGGSCVLVMLRSMWPSVQNIPNSMPESSGTNTRDFMCFFLFWFISLPAIWFPIHKIRHLFTAKAIVVPIAGIAFFVWSIVKAKGVGPIIHRPAKLHGSELGWMMVKSLMSCISNMATLVVNAPDFASRARRPADAMMPQLIAVPLGFSLVSFLGIIVSSSSEVIYGEPVWSPIDLLGKLLDGSPSHATRFGVWFISASFILAQITEYWLIRRGHYRIADLYHTERNGWYWYTLGINPKAYVAYISGILINVVGFAGATGQTVPLAATRIYQMAFFTGFGVSSIIYYVLNRIWPSPGSWQNFEEVDESEWHPAEDHRHDSRDEDEYSIKKRGDDAFVREVPVS